jgi:hypothetical protein
MVEHLGKNHRRFDIFMLKQLLHSSIIITRLQNSAFTQRSVDLHEQKGITPYLGW